VKRTRQTCNGQLVNWWIKTHSYI